MERIRINLILESDSDADLYSYLINTPPRRRATLLRALASQGLNGSHLLKAGITKAVTENKPETAYSVIKNDAQINIDDAKQKSFSSAFDDMMEI
ncbi:MULTISPECIES: hypothetical protein [Methylobacter]